MGVVIFMSKGLLTFDFLKFVEVKLPDEGGIVAMLKMVGKDISGEITRRSNQYVLSLRAILDISEILRVLMVGKKVHPAVVSTS